MVTLMRQPKLRAKKNIKMKKRAPTEMLELQDIDFKIAKNLWRKKACLNLHKLFAWRRPKRRYGKSSLLLTAYQLVDLRKKKFSKIYFKQLGD
jgi:hypothetical protein